MRVIFEQVFLGIENERGLKTVQEKYELSSLQ